MGINHVVWAVIDWPIGDLDVYLAAAQRLQAGEELYVADLPSYATFWYAPWFAVAFIPLTWLPYESVAVGWSTVLVAASILTVFPLVRRPTQARLALAALLFPLLFAVSAGGNVQPLLVLALARGFQRRAGPLWVGVAASLKITPILLALAYVAQGAWWRAAASVGIFAALIAPGLAMGLFTARPSELFALGLFGVSLPLYALSVLGAAALVFRVSVRYAPLAAAVAAVLALPRLFAYDATLLAAGLSPLEDRDTS